MSFLDVVSCGFGAIILLLVIARSAEPVVIERISEDLEGVIARQGREVHEIRGRATALNRTLKASDKQLAEARGRLEALRAELAALQGQRSAAVSDHQVHTAIAEQLAEAKQSLTAEMRRLLGRHRRDRPDDASVGGVPVDSEYIIFIIDTSGSMAQNAWPLVRRKLQETLAIYPQVKGIQVMNDMGNYMFSQYARRWIPDTPARRQAILKRLGSWSPFSNSSPVEGITEAISRFYAADRKISLYVFGDEFSHGSLEAVARTVARLNRADASGTRRVRIHAVGFPVQFAYPGAAQITGIRFAALMRTLAEQNGGTFVGLPSFRR